MTRSIEDRLRDAFSTGAELVRPESLGTVTDTVAVRPRRRFRGLPLLAAAAVVVVLAVVALVAKVVVPAPAPPPVLMPSDGNEALRRLAARVARSPDDRGAYWRRSLENSQLVRVRAGGRVFNAVVSHGAELWLPRDAEDPVQTRSEEPGLRPATPAEERAWRAAGSPAEVQRVCTPGTKAADCVKLPMGARSGECRYTYGVAPDRGPAAHPFGPYTPAEIWALPTDDKGLRAWLRARWESNRAEPGTARTLEEALAGSDLLLRTPLSPAARAAVLRLLADLPTTSVRGPAKDPLGRSGLAVDFDKGRASFREFGEDDEVAEEHTTILDPSTGEILAEVTKAGESAAGVAKGGIMDSEVWTPVTGWTADRPKRPGNCRRL
ncbi:CU044_5270 family protein [Nonomuraea pusilla]|uniref:CU044_5270 family protein n=1 Tax=Nonomuraea pusilla TaxID=46177 RepID=UPI0033305C42